MDFPIIEDSTLVDRIEHVVALTWTQRLLSWPWRPWVKTRSWFTTVPSRQMLRVGNVVHMHPEAARALRLALARQRMEANFYGREVASHTNDDFVLHAPPYVKRVKPQMPPHRNPAEPVPFPDQPWRAADAGHEAMDSMLNSFESKRNSQAQECDAPKINNYGFPSFDRREPDPPGETQPSYYSGDSSSSSESYGGSD